jgi:hypothetical protein
VSDLEMLGLALDSATLVACDEDLLVVGERAATDS